MCPGCPHHEIAPILVGAGGGSVRVRSNPCTRTESTAAAAGSMGEGAAKFGKEGREEVVAAGSERS